MKDRNKRAATDTQEVVLLKDLMPRRNPKGGGGASGKTIFDGGPITGTSEGKAAEKKVRKDW